ncbi:MAG TPA: Ig-like domain-containing protein [Frankiaceae bacterium]|nr:Ig-like domain-containing protein [Frankiaceae bacterium]
MAVRPTLRRALAVVTGTTLALGASPMLGTALAAAPVAGALSPADGSTVQPPATVSICYAGTIAVTSTIVVTGETPKAGTTSIGDCATGGSDNKLIFTPASAFADGEYSVTAVAGDPALPITTTQTEWSFTVDGTDPAVPNTLTITNPVGPSNQTNVTVSGKTSASTPVSVSIANSPTPGATATGNGVSNGTGDFTISGIDATALAEGALLATVTATDSAGNDSSATIASVKDTTAPVRTSTVPADGGTSQTTSTVAVTFNEALDATSTILVKNGVGGTMAGTKSFSNGDKTITYTTTSPMTPAGNTFTITTNAKDVVGNTETSSTTFTIDETDPAAPTVDLTDPINDANKAAAVVSGVAEPGSTVDVSVDDATPGSPVTASGTADLTSGAYSINVDLTSLADGAVVATATATDAAGNEGPEGTSDASTKDTVAPGAPTVSMTDPVNNGNKTTVTVSGIAENGSAVSISVDDTTAAPPVTTTATADAVDGTYTKNVDLSSLADGVVTATVTAADAAGNVSPAGTDTATKDTGVPTAPTLSVPDVNDANKAAVTASGTAEPGSTVLVTIEDADTVLDETTTAHATTGAYSVPFDVSSLDDGTLTATAKSTDASGNESPVTSIPVEKDTAAPGAPTVTMPAYVNDATKAAIEISGTAEEGSTIDITVSDTDGGTANVTSSVVTAPNGSWTKTLDLSSLTDGTLTASATATDVAGNASSAGTDTATKDVVKPSAPTVTLSEPIDSTNGATSTASGSAENGSTVDVSVNDTDAATAPVTGSDVSDGSYSVPLDLSSLSDGTLTATATATDAAGNVSTSGTDTAPKDTVVLDVVSASPAHNSTVQPPSSVSMTMNEPMSTSLSTITLTDSTNSQLAGATTFTNGNKTIVFTPVDTLSDAGSPYTVMVSAKDTDGTDSLAAGAVFTVDGTPPAAPSVSIPEVVNAANVAAVTVSGVAEPGSSVLVSVDDATAGSPVTDTETAHATTGAYSTTLDLTSLADGALTATAVATDGVGNASSAGTDTATKDAAVPAAPSVSIPEVVNAANVAAVTVSGVAEPGSSVLISVDDATAGSPVTDTETAHATTGAYSTTLDLTSLADGALTATAVATDGAGNASSAGSDSATKDATVPGAPSVSLSDPVNAANTTTVTVSGVAEPGSTVNISLDDATAGDPLTDSTTANGLGEYSESFDVTTLADGVLTATVTATDAAGNTSPAGTDTATKDSSIPDKPTLDTPAEVTRLTVAAAPFSGTAEEGTTVDISIDDSDAGTPAVTGSDVADADDEWSVTLNLSSLDDGMLTITITATDAVGNTSATTTDAVAKNVTRAFTVGVSPTPVSGAAQTFTVTANQTYSEASETDTTYTGTPVLSSLDTHFTAGTCAPAVAGVSECTGTVFGDLGAFSLKAEEGTGDDLVTGSEPVTVQPTGLVFSVAPQATAVPGEAIEFTVVPTVGVTGAVITGYDAVQTLVTGGGGGSTPVNGSVLTCPATCATSVSFDSRGPKTIKVTDNGTPSLSTPTATVNIPYGTVLTLTRSALQVNSGSYVTLSGKLTNSTLVTGVAGRTVKIYRRTAPNTVYKYYTSVTTKADGSWVKRLSLVRNTGYQARFSGDDTHLPSLSTRRLVKAAQVVSAAWSKTGRTVKVSGRVAPNAAGRTIYLQYRKADGTWGSAGASATVSATGAYAISRTFAAGTYVLRTAIAATSVNAAGYSSRYSVTL